MALLMRPSSNLYTHALRQVCARAAGEAKLSFRRHLLGVYHLDHWTGAAPQLHQRMRLQVGQTPAAREWYHQTAAHQHHRETDLHRIRELVAEDKCQGRYTTEALCYYAGACRTESGTPSR